MNVDGTYLHTVFNEQARINGTSPALVLEIVVGALISLLGIGCYQIFKTKYTYEQVLLRNMNLSYRTQKKLVSSPNILEDGRFIMVQTNRTGYVVPT